MSRRPWYAGAGARTQQTGTVMALALMPTTFQRTLMPRSTLDQALTTGICGALDYVFAALIQDTVEAVALRISGSTSPEQVDPHTWRRASIAGDLAAIALGLAGQTACRPRPGERVPRGALRTICWWISVTGLCGAVAGALQEQAGRGNATDEDSVPVALAAGMLLAGVNEYRRRRSEAADTEAGSSEDASVSALKSLVMSLGVTGGLSAMAAGERVFATRVSRLLARVLSGSERVYRPVGHAAALSVFGMAIHELIKWVNHRAEHMADTVERAFATAPNSSMVSGGPGSPVSWDSLSREGRRNVSTVLRAQLIEAVMGEPSAAEPIRVYVGLESAPTEYERRDLVLRELQRTGAFDRKLLMVISPTGTGYVNYVAVEAAEYMTRGNIASMTMQYSLRPSVLSLDRVAEGRLQYRMLIDAIHDKLAERPVGRRPRVVIFGESLGAWTSQDAFEHRGTQGLLDAAIDRAIWIGTPYISKWKQEVLGGDRPDVDPSLLRSFNDFGQLQALDRKTRERLRYVMITHDDDGVADFGLDLLARAPGWLAPAKTRPAGVPKTEQWRSPTTFVQTLIDMKNSANVIPGQFEAKGHDYRADLARFVREVYALQASDKQLASIEAALRANDLQRAALLTAHQNQGDVAETGHPEQREKVTAGTRRPRNPPSAGAEVAASAATLAYNVAISRPIPGIGYVMANDSAAVLSVIAARACGVSRADMGMCPGRLGGGIRIGLTTALPAAAVVGLGAVAPAVRGFFHDERARGGGTRHALFETLVRIPLGTALPEEVIFRGSLLGLFTQRHSPAVAASMSSILFGVWHVLPTLRTLPLNPAGARVHGNPMRTAGVVLATVTATTLAGYGLAWLRFRSGSIAAPVVAHASLNGAAYLAARFVTVPSPVTCRVRCWGTASRPNPPISERLFRGLVRLTLMPQVGHGWKPRPQPGSGREPGRAGG